MAHQKRLIAASMFEDEWFMMLDIYARLLWIGMIVKAADDQGRMTDSPALIKSKVFPSDEISSDVIEHYLTEFAAQGKITRYNAAGKQLIQINNWWKHQSPAWADKSRFPAPEGWIDREKFHGPGNTVIVHGWNTEGGYLPVPELVYAPPEPPAEHTEVRTPVHTGTEEIEIEIEIKDKNNTVLKESDSVQFASANSTPRVPEKPASSVPPHKRNQPDPALVEFEQKMLDQWKVLFPTKPQPRPGTYRVKIGARMKHAGFKEKWLDGLAIASLSPTCQNESWFDFEFFVRNDANYEKCLNDYWRWKDEKEYGKGGSTPPPGQQAQRLSREDMIRAAAGVRVGGSNGK